MPVIIKRIIKKQRIRNEKMMLNKNTNIEDIALVNLVASEVLGFFLTEPTETFDETLRSAMGVL